MTKTAFGRPLPIPLHGQARVRRWLGHQLGGDVELGDRIWRRLVHAGGSLVLLYFVIPGNFLILPWAQTTEVILLLLLLGVLSIELLRHYGVVEVPAIREYERGRIASFAWYAMALTAAVLLFPEPIAIVMVLGAAFIDPLAGELRHRSHARRNLGVFAAAYTGMAAASLVFVGGWKPAIALGAGLGAALLALAVEGPRTRVYDDDIGMTIVPGLFLLALVTFVPAVVGP